MAIGGVTPENIRSFFAAGYIGVGLASSLMPKAAVVAGDWEACTVYVKELVAQLPGGNHCQLPDGKS